MLFQEDMNTGICWGRKKRPIFGRSNQKSNSSVGVLPLLEELKTVIYHGDVIEEYPDDRPSPSCLIVGRVRGGFPLYVVCGLARKVHIITVHWLDPAKWLDPQTRREKE